MHFGNFKESAERKKIKQKKGSFFRPLHHTAKRKTPGGKTICSLIRKGDEIGKTHTVKKTAWNGFLFQGHTRGL